MKCNYCEANAETVNNTQYCLECAVKHRDDHVVVYEDLTENIENVWFPETAEPSFRAKATK